MNVDIEIKLDHKVQVSIDVEDVIYAINELPIAKRWNTIGTIINEIDMSPGSEELTAEQKVIISGYLQQKIDLLK